MAFIRVVTDEVLKIGICRHVSDCGFAFAHVTEN
jgi:hypothetical protein